MTHEQQGFDVIVQSSPTSMDDWQRAQFAPSSDLPDLTEEQKEIARKFGLSEESYKRSYLSLVYGEERARSRGEKLGQMIRECLTELGSDYKLHSVTWDMEQWVARVRTQKRMVSVPIPRELADDFLDSGDAVSRDEIKFLVSLGVAEKQAEKK